MIKGTNLVLECPTTLKVTVIQQVQNMLFVNYFTMLSDADKRNKMYRCVVIGIIITIRQGGNDPNTSLSLMDFL